MLLLDIEKAAIGVESYIKSMAQAAVEREFIIAGSALYQLDRRWPGLVDLIPNTGTIAGLALQLFYHEEIDPEIIRNAAVNEIPEMRQTARTLVMDGTYEIFSTDARLAWLASDEPRTGNCSWLLNRENVYGSGKETQGEGGTYRYEFADGSAITTDLDDWEFGVHREWLDDPAVLEYCRQHLEDYPDYPDTIPQFVGESRYDPRWKQEWILPRPASAVPTAQRGH